MQPNLRYLQYAQPPLDEDYDPEADDIASEVQAADPPPLRVTGPPAGYIASDGGGSLAPDSAVTPIGSPREMPVIRYEKTPIKWTDANGPHNGIATTPTRDSIPSPYPQSKVVPMPTSPGWVAGTDAENTLPFKGAPLPAPAERFIGKDRDLQGALKTARGVDAEMPIRPMPKLLNRIGADALGGLAGWSNAAGRAAPIDIKGTTDAILYPGYDRKLASWQSRQASAKQQVDNFGQQVGADIASQKANADSTLKFAQAEAAIKHGDYWERRSEQERNQWKLAQDGSLYNTISGQRVAAPEDKNARFKAAMALTGGDKEKSAFYALNGKLPTPTQHNVSEWQSYLDANGGDSAAALKAKNADDIHKAIASRDPSMANYRNFEEQQRMQDTLNRINKERVDEEQRIQSDRQAKLTALTTSGQGADRARREADINRTAAAALQAMQQKYVDGIRGQHGNAQEFDIDPATLQWKPRVTVATAANPYNPQGTTGNPYRRSGQ